MEAFSLVCATHSPAQISNSVVDPSAAPVATSFPWLSTRSVCSGMSVTCRVAPTCPPHNQINKAPARTSQTRCGQVESTLRPNKLPRIDRQPPCLNGGPHGAKP